MNPYTKRLFDHERTPATALAYTAWINQYDTCSSFFRFERCVLQQLIPRGIGDAFCQMMILEHTGDSQVLEHNCSKLVNEFPTHLMREVLAPVGNPLVATGNHLSPLDTPQSTLFFGTQPTRCLFQIMRIVPKKAWVGNHFTRAQGGKLFQSNVNPNRSLWHICSWRCCLLSRKTDVSFARAVALAGNGFDCSFNGTVEVHCYCTHFAQDHPFASEPCAVPVVGIGQQIIATKPFETGETCFRYLGFHTAKKRLERQINTHLNVLHYLAVNQFERFTFGFPIRKEVNRVVKCERRARIFIHLLSRGKCLVIHPPAFLKLLLKDAGLAARQV